MSGHGYRSPLTLLETTEDNFLRHALSDPKRTNIFGAADSTETFLSGHADHPTETKRALHKLAKRMKEPFWNPSPPGENTNKTIPAGYTYFGQLLAHDLAQHVTPFPLALTQPSNPAMENDNLRNRGLILDSVYGGGPLANPSAYEPRAEPKDVRVHLRLGRIRKPEAIHPSIDDPLRDIPRVAYPEFFGGTCPHLDRGESDRSDSPPPYADTLLVDGRNDDNLVISQITMLFHTLHNWIYDQLDSFSARETQFGFLNEDYYRFITARKITTLIYRNIVVKDYLKKVLHKDVYCLFDDSSFECSESGLNYTNKGVEGDVTVEFSHAAFRFGHAMIRPQYKLNCELNATVSDISELLRRNSALGARNMPLESNWIVEWHRFFDLGSPALQFSHRLGPSFPPEFFSETTLLGQTGSRYSLPELDFFRAAEGGLHKLAFLIQKLPCSLKNKSAILSSKTGPSDAVTAWLEKTKPFDVLDDLTLSEKRIVLSDPPLLLFILIEAAVGDTEGRKLGILGSAIVADTMFRVLRRGHDSIEGDHSVKQLATRLFSDGIPENMGELISHLPAFQKNGGCIKHLV